MSHVIHNAISKLESCRISSSVEQSSLANKRLQCFITHILRQLRQYLQNPTIISLEIIIDEIQNALTHDYEILFWDDCENGNNQQVLNNVLKELLDYHKNIKQSETVRENLKDYFQSIPQQIISIMDNIIEVEKFIEDEVSNDELIYNQDSDILKRHVSRLHELYQEFMQQDSIKRGELFKEPIDIYSNPINQEYDPVATESSETTYSGDLYLYQCFLNIVINLQSFYRELSQYVKLQGISEIKANIRSICRTLIQLHRLVEELVDSHDELRELMVLLQQQKKISDSGIMLNLIRFMDRLMTKLKVFETGIHSIREAATLVFAYVLDESITRVAERGMPSRLERLLSGKVFEPLSDKDVQSAYEDFTLQLAMSLRKSMQIKDDEEELVPAAND